VVEVAPSWVGVGQRRGRRLGGPRKRNDPTRARVQSLDIDRPDLNRYPRSSKVTVLEVVAEPGDTVFLPLGWWHQVAALDVSLSFSYSCLDVPNEFSYVNPEIWNW
jgi:ribosomal protein L16 Arg81 hydroxylase